MEAIRILREEHDVILRALDVLSVMAFAADRGELPRHQDATELLDFIREYSDGAHHQKEEGMLFPAMERAGLPRTGGPLAVMLAEHEEGRDLVSRAAAALAAPGLPVDAARAFGHAAGEYVGLMRHHIIKENQVLFVIAEKRIGAGAAADLDAAFADVAAREGEVRRLQETNLEALEARYVKAVA